MAAKTRRTTEMSENAILDMVNRGERAAQPRWDLIGRWRDKRYGRTSSRKLIPDALRATDYDHHDLTFNKACIELASFASAAEVDFIVDAPSNAKKEEAQDLQEAIHAILGPGGVLDRESNNQVPFVVWGNQGENGHGIYKLIMKSSYPLSMPQRDYAHEKTRDDVEYEDNPEYKPTTLREGRIEKGTTKYRETDDSLKRRREEFEREEFPFAWTQVDPRTAFTIMQGDVAVLRGEISQRPAIILDRYGCGDLRTKTSGYLIGAPAPKDSPTAGSTGEQMVTCFEAWSDSHGYFGFISGQVGSGGVREVTFARSADWCWVNPFQRIPYFDAFGIITTEEDDAGRYHGLFDSLIAETDLINYYETLAFNTAFRQHVPLYQPVMDGTYTGEKVALNAEQQTMVTEDKIEEIDLPPGWKWEPINPGSEVDLFKQLDAARQRMTNNALAAVLTGRAAAGDSGASVSLMLNAAQRALSPIVRNHEHPMAEMASTILETAKRMRLTLEIDEYTDDGTGNSTVKKLVVKPDNIVSTRVRCSMKVELPVDQAALESRGMALRLGGHASFDTVGPKYLGIADVEKERKRIRDDKFRPLSEQVAWRMAVQRLATEEPEIFADLVGDLIAPSPVATVGGGPGGAYGGAATEAARGAPALPGSTQIDGAPAAVPTASAAPQSGGFRMSDGR